MSYPPDDKLRHKVESCLSWCIMIAAALIVANQYVLFLRWCEWAVS